MLQTITNIKPFHPSKFHKVEYATDMRSTVQIWDDLAFFIMTTISIIFFAIFLLLIAVIFHSSLT